MVVVKVVDHDIFDKVDTQYIENQLSSLPNIGIVFICTREGGEEDDWTEENGMRYIVIHLPYEEVRQSVDGRMDISPPGIGFQFCLVHAPHLSS